MIILCIQPTGLQQKVVFKTNTFCGCNFILLRTLRSYLALQTVEPPPSLQVHSQQSLPGNNHLLCRLVKTFSITKGVGGNAFCFRVFQFHLLSSFSQLFFFAIGILLELLQNLCSMIIPMSLNVVMEYIKHLLLIR